MMKQLPAQLVRYGAHGLALSESMPNWSVPPCTGPPAVSAGWKLARSFPPLAGVEPAAEPAEPAEPADVVADDPAGASVLELFLSLLHAAMTNEQTANVASTDRARFLYFIFPPC